MKKGFGLRIHEQKALERLKVKIETEKKKKKK